MPRERREFPPRAYRDPSVLRALLLGRGLSCREAAARLGCGPTSVSVWARRYGIPTRDEPEELAQARD